VTTDEFANITQRVIGLDGFAEFQPTACYPARRHIKTLAGLPPNLKPETPVLEWAGSSAEPNEEFLVAFKVDPTHFTVIRCAGSFKEVETYVVQ
jgi:hypothetical protein